MDVDTFFFPFPMNGTNLLKMPMAVKYFYVPPPWVCSKVGLFTSLDQKYELKSDGPFDCPTFHIFDLLHI